MMTNGSIGKQCPNCKQYRVVYEREVVMVSGKWLDGFKCLNCNHSWCEGNKE